MSHCTCLLGGNVQDNPDLSLSLSLIWHWWCGHWWTYIQNTILFFLYELQLNSFKRTRKAVKTMQCDLSLGIWAIGINVYLCTVEHSRYESIWETRLRQKLDRCDSVWLDNKEDPAYSALYVKYEIHECIGATRDVKHYFKYTIQCTISIDNKHIRTKALCTFHVYPSQPLYSKERWNEISDLKAEDQNGTFIMCSSFEIWISA